MKPCSRSSTDSFESAPVFSLVGFLVRLRGSGNPDKNWVSVFQNRKLSLPSARMVKDDHRHDDSYRGRASRAAFKLNHANRDMDSESYHELHEGNTYDVQVGRSSARREECVPGEVYVTQEYRVDSLVV